MGIYHDAYLVNLHGLKDNILFYLTMPKKQAIFQLSQSISNLFDTNQTFRHLNNDYGGWDKNGIVSEFAENDVKTNFLIMLIIYTHISNLPNQVNIGLGHQYNLLSDILNRTGWENSTIEKLIYGNGFLDYAKFYFQFDLILPEYQYWNFIKPYSTASTLGWLNQENLQFLSYRITDTHEKSNYSEEESACLNSAKEMLSKAIHSKMDLCLITSG